MSRIECHIRLYAGFWDRSSPHRSLRGWIRRLIESALARRGELLEKMRFVTAEPNDSDLVATVETVLTWLPDDSDVLVEYLQEQLVSWLKPESEHQIEVEIMDTHATLDDFACVSNCGSYDDSRWEQ